MTAMSLPTPAGAVPSPSSPRPSLPTRRKNLVTPTWHPTSALPARSCTARLR